MRLWDAHDVAPLPRSFKKYEYNNRLGCPHCHHPHRLRRCCSHPTEPLSDSRYGPDAPILWGVHSFNGKVPGAFDLIYHRNPPDHCRVGSCDLWRGSTFYQAKAKIEVPFKQRGSGLFCSIRRRWTPLSQPIHRRSRADLILFNQICNFQV